MMRVTAKQATVLANLQRIVFESRSAKRRWTLDGEECHLQLNALAAMRIIAWDKLGRPVKIAEPEGIKGTRNWRARSAVSLEPTMSLGDEAAT